MDLKKTPLKILIVAGAALAMSGCAVYPVGGGGVAYGPAYGVGYVQPAYVPNYSVEVYGGGGGYRGRPYYGHGYRGRHGW